MEGFAFKQQLRLGGIDSGVYASTTLNETLSLVDDYLVINYDTQFESDDLIDMKEKQREHIKPQFSESTEHMRDV